VRNGYPNIFEIRFNFESTLIIVSAPRVMRVFSVQSSVFSPAAGLKSGQFNQKRNLMDPQKIDVLAKALRRKENII